MLQSTASKLDIDFSHKPLNLQESFELVRSILFRHAYSLPEALSKIFETGAMNTKHQGMRQVVPEILQKTCNFPKVIVLTDIEKIIELLKLQRQNRPSIVSHAVEMVKGAPNVFTASKKEDWENFRYPLQKYLKGKVIDKREIEIAQHLIAEYCTDRKIKDVADFAAIYSARVFGETVLGYKFTNQVALDVANAYANTLQPKIMRNIINNSLFGRDFPRTRYSKNKIKAAVDLFADIADRVIKHALENPNHESYTIDLIKRVIEHKKIDKEAFTKKSESYKYVSSQIMIMLAGGIEAPRKQLYSAMHYLARNPKWQESIDPYILDGDVQTKQVYPVLLEATRLGSPVYCMLKETADEIQYVIPLSAILSSQEHWGEDADQFNPQRFEDNPLRLKSKAMLAFGYGPHGCPGETKAYRQNAAMIIALKQTGVMKTVEGQAHMPIDTVSFLTQPAQGTQLVLK